MDMTSNLRDSDHYRRLAAEATAREAERRYRRNTAPTDEERWYLAHIGVRNDERAVERLRQHGFECYYPHLRKLVFIPLNRLSAKQRKAKIKPFEPKIVALCPKYPFIRFDLRRADWREVFEYAGIWGMQVARDGDRPLPLPVADAVIAEIRAREVDGTIPGELPMREFAYKVGEVVRITDGAFRGFDAIVEDLPNLTLGEVDEDARMALTVYLFGRSNRVELPLSAIAKR